MNGFGDRRIYYNNFADHLLNSYNPNMFYPGLPYRWSDDDWRGVIEMVAGFGFNTWEFWLVPRLFCRNGIDSDSGRAFKRQVNVVIEHAHSCGMQVEMICGLATVGPDWHTLCPRLPSEWNEIKFLWKEWVSALPGVDIVGIFPGDPGACSRNGCTALTYIDKSVEIAALVKSVLPHMDIEFHTWGPPFFGWGIIQGPADWHGEFIQDYQHTAWTFDRVRAEESMNHLVKRLPDFPNGTSVAVNMGFNPDGNPEGDQDARSWVREIASTNRVHSWDFSLTEGENNVVPHYRFKRLFERRRLERECGVYSGGICYTMTPLLNQLSLYEAAQSFLNPDADPDRLAGDFYENLYGSDGRKIVPYLRLFEVVQDWGNYHETDIAADDYHARMKSFAGCLRDLEGNACSDTGIFPSAEQHRRDLLFFAKLFCDLSGSHPDYDGLRRRYWDKVYGIYDVLPEHVDPRPKTATSRLVERFALEHVSSKPTPGKWT